MDVQMRMRRSDRSLRIFTKERRLDIMRVQAKGSVQGFRSGNPDTRARHSWKDEQRICDMEKDVARLL